MFRIRKKAALIYCATFLIIVLFLYILINSPPFSLEKKAFYKDINEQLQEWETKAKQAAGNNDNVKYKLYQNKNQIVAPKIVKDKGVFINSSIIRADGYGTCSIMTDMTSPPDIQMLELYKEIPFDNVNGGAWTQGWEITYDSRQFNRNHKLKVFVVPHSHNDPGWLSTFDEYYEYTTKHILFNMLRHLSANPTMTFIWAEICYFSRWYNSLTKTSRDTVKRLIKNHQLEFVTGGWVMPDEANSHWLSMLMQLTEGQTWLQKHLNITPKSSWSIDPFGQSPTMPYILKHSGMENVLIQRTHYSVKKRLAQKQELEFRWRQIWDGTGETDIFTHMMPFSSYDISHSCGPDPKVCYQFDFKKLLTSSFKWPWSVEPQPINDDNVVERSKLLLDQWRKKSQLYRTRSILIPLGDDFRFSQEDEWDVQQKNYEKLFDYINNEPKLFTEVKFATLQDYFDSIRLENQINDFPSLSGDFFTYADRDDNYWSGYYTSRPYHKRMDRVLLHYIRSAEMLRSWHRWEQSSEIDALLEYARQQLSLFQHHDGITGTARAMVVEDYAARMLEAVKGCKFVLQQAAYRLLTKKEIYAPNYKFTYFHLDDSQWPGPEDDRTTIVLGEGIQMKYVVFFNSLPRAREQLVEFYVSKPHVKVTDFKLKPVISQITPVWSWDHKSRFYGIIPSVEVVQPSSSKYKLLFKVQVPPLGLSTYVIHSSFPGDKNSDSTFAEVTILTKDPYSINLAEYPVPVHFEKPGETSLRIGQGPIANFSPFGLLKSVALDESSQHIPLNISFLKYRMKVFGGASGAYLFLPDGPATPLRKGSPITVISKGVLESSITTHLPFAKHETVLRGSAIEIRNIVDIRNMENTEIVMRISSHINSGDIFYTDLNGMQMIKRQRFSKIPLQGNYYPIPSSIYIEDEKTRLTLLTAQPLGGSSLKSGEIEIMQDRRLQYDDHRGLGEGVLDNQPVLHIFRVLLENVKECRKSSDEYPAGFLTEKAHAELVSLLHPIDKMVWKKSTWIGALGSFGNDHQPLPTDFEVGVMRYLPNIPSHSKNNTTIGVVLHRTQLEQCSNEKTDGNVNIKSLLQLNNNTKIYSSPLTLLKIEKLISHNIKFCPMDVKSFIIQS